MERESVLVVTRAYSRGKRSLPTDVDGPTPILARLLPVPSATIQGLVHVSLSGTHVYSG